MGRDNGAAKAQAAAMKLALGTVQFGCSYGVSNQNGQVPFDEVKRILDLATDLGVDTLDTAIGYGSAEDVLGRVNCRRFRVISKLPPLASDISEVYAWVRDQVAASLQRLKIESLDCILLHRPSDLSGSRGEELAAALIKLKTSGLSRRIGVSIYGPQELQTICNVLLPDVVQAPMNLVDRRLESSGWLSRLRAINAEIHVRSVFLQGLLLMESEDLPPQFEQWKWIWERRDRILAETKRSRIEACLSYPLGRSDVSRIVVGVQTAEQLRAISAARVGDYDKNLDSLMSNDLLLINPSKWSHL